MMKGRSVSRPRQRREPPNAPSPDTFYFFRIMIGPFQTTLYIPPKAAERLDALLGQCAYLEDSNGKSWKVQVSSVENSLAFHQGWGQFVRDHDIVYGDFIVFRYNGGQNFSIKVFGISGCERLAFPSSNNLSNDLPPLKRRKHHISPTNEISHGLHNAGLVTAKTSQPCDNQFLHVKSKLPLYSPKECNTESPAISASKKSIVDIELAEMPHESDKLKSCERLAFPSSNNLSNDLPPRKRRKHPISSTNKISHGLHNAGLVTATTSQPCNNQFLHIKSKFPLYSLKEYNTESPAISVSKKSMVDIELAEMSHESDKLKSINFQDKSSTSVDIDGCNDSTDVLEKQNLSAEGAKFLVDKDGICFLLFDEHTSTEPYDGQIASPISVDVSAMTNDTVVANDVICHDNENPIASHLFKVNCDDSHDFETQDLSTSLGQCATLDFGGNEPDMAKTYEVPSIENTSCISNMHVPSSPKLTDFRGNDPDMAKIDEVPSVENASCISNLDVPPPSPKLSVSHLFKVNCDDRQDFETQDLSTNLGQDATLDMARIDRVPSFENASCISNMDVAPQSPKLKEKPLDMFGSRETVVSHEYLQCMAIALECPGSPKPPESPVPKGDLVKTDEVPSVENSSCISYVDVTSQCPKSTEKPLDIVGSREIVLSHADLQCLAVAFECPGNPKPIGALEPAVLTLPEAVRYTFSIDDKTQWYQELSSPLPLKGNMRIDRKVVLLRDSPQRLWPVVYHEKHDPKFTGFCSGWSAFASANGIKGGSECILELAQGHDALFDVKIS